MDVCFSDKYNNSLSSSTASETVPENNKSIDTVSKLFSNLFKNSESACSANCKSLTSAAAAVDDFLLLTNSDDPFSNFTENFEPKTVESTGLKDASFNSELKASVVDNNQQSSKEKSLLAVSSETVILDGNKNVQTPFSSKIPVLHCRSDDGLSVYSEDVKKNRNVGLKFVNMGSLKRICSNSKIPVSTRKPCTNIDRNRNCLQSSSCSYKQQSHQSTQVQKRTERNAPGNKYTHVKSKLAAYIHRPMKGDCPKINRSTSPLDRRLKNDMKNDCPYSNNYSCIRRVSSRSSLDTYTCDYKTPLPDFQQLDFEKSDDTDHCQRIRRHFELAAEHSRIKSEKEKVIIEYQSIIAKQHQLVLEHGEKANEHTLKAISLILNKVTDQS